MRGETLWVKKQLETFLLKHRAEVKMMILSEYNEELHLKNEREIAREEGIRQLNMLYQQLLDDKRLDDLKRVPTDRAFQEKLMVEYNII
jgi:hypothetical protein